MASHFIKTRTIDAKLFEVDDEELHAMAPTAKEVLDHVMKKRVEQFMANPGPTRGLADFLEQYRQHDLAQLKGDR